MMNGQIKLRPHHILCIQFFVGKGYSADFVSNMTAVIERLRTENPEVTLCEGCDILCASCPENHEGKCQNHEKVSAIDSRCLKETGFSLGITIRWTELQQTAYEKVIHCGRLKDVCCTCQWQEICMQ